MCLFSVVFVLSIQFYFIFSVFRHFCKQKTEMNFIYSQFNLYFTVWNKRNMLEIIYCAHRSSHLCLYTVNRNGFSISHFGLILQRIFFRKEQIFINLILNNQWLSSFFDHMPTNLQCKRIGLNDLICFILFYFNFNFWNCFVDVFHKILFEILYYSRKNRVLL